MVTFYPETKTYSGVSYINQDDSLVKRLCLVSMVTARRLPWLYGMG